MITVPSPNYFNGRAGYKASYVILHGTAGFETAEEVANYFASTQGVQEADRVSAHYVVGRDGTVIQCVDEANGAWSNGFISGTPATLGFREVGDGVHRDSWWDPAINPNYQTIAIEHVKPSTDNSDELTALQATASFALISAICDRWNIPKRFADSQGGITGHFSMDPLNRSMCPGPYPWQELWNYFEGEDMLQITDPFAAAFFKETSPTTWHCTATNIDIHDAILDYYRQTQGAFRLPRTPEIYDVLPTGCSFQVFEGGVLVFDPTGKYDSVGRTVYAMHLDKDTPGLHQLIDLAGLTLQSTPPTTPAQQMPKAS